MIRALSPKCHYLARKSALLERRNITLNELTKAEEILANTLSKLPAQRIRAEQAIVKSTSDGTITNINFYTIGAVVEAGMKLAEIVPDDDDLVVEARVLPQDVSFIQDGMKAYISLTSYDESIYGRAKGEVLKVSANTRSDQDGVTFYIATLSADFEEFSNKVNGIIQPGMQTQISIIGDKRTVLGYLFSPVTKLTSKAFREK
jgi:Multidrug resistance efflux pump